MPGPKHARARRGCPCRFAGLWSGARSMQSSICAQHLVVDQHRVREALAAVDDAVADGVDVADARRPRRSPDRRDDPAEDVVEAARWSRSGAVRPDGGAPSARRVIRRLAADALDDAARELPSASCAMASRSVAMNWNLSDELPQLRTSTFTSPRPASASRPPRGLGGERPWPEPRYGPIDIGAVDTVALDKCGRIARKVFVPVTWTAVERSRGRNATTRSRARCGLALGSPPAMTGGVSVLRLSQPGSYHRELARTCAGAGLAGPRASINAASSIRLRNRGLGSLLGRTVWTIPPRTPGTDARCGKIPSRGLLGRAKRQALPSR